MRNEALNGWIEAVYIIQSNNPICPMPRNAHKIRPWANRTLTTIDQKNFFETVTYDQKQH